MNTQNDYLIEANRIFSCITLAYAENYDILAMIAGEFAEYSIGDIIPLRAELLDLLHNKFPRAFIDLCEDIYRITDDIREQKQNRVKADNMNTQTETKINASTIIDILNKKILDNEVYYKGSITLHPSKTGIIIPSTVFDIPLHEETLDLLRDWVINWLTPIAKSVSFEPRKGTWTDDDDNIIYDDGLFVWTHTTDDNKAEIEETIIHLAHVLGQILSQEAVLIYVNDKPRLLI